MTGELFDPGAQPERTELAWRRTTLALLVATSSFVHLEGRELASAAPVVTVGGLVAVPLVWWAGRRRARRRSTALLCAGQLPGAGALLGFGLLASTFALCGGVLSIIGSS